MKVSIITICFNSAATIEDTIQSVLAQDYDDIEYILVDGASRDNTLAIIEKYKSRIAKVVSEPDKGIYDAMNKGLALATGQIIGILNSDDIYAYNGVITDVVQKFHETNADGIYADLVYVDRDHTSRIIRYWKSGKYRPGAFKYGWMPPHPAFFVKKQVYDQYGHFNLTLRSAADYEIMLRFIHKHKISVGYLPKVVTKMRVGGQSNVTVKNRYKANREDKLAWQLNGLKPLPVTFILKPLRKVGQFINKKAKI